MLRRALLATLLYLATCRASDSMPASQAQGNATMTSAAEPPAPVPVRVLLDGETAAITLTCLSPNLRPIEYIDTRITYERKFDDGRVQDIAGGNTFPALGTAKPVQLNNKDVGVSWSLNVTQADAGVYYCKMMKQDKDVVAHAAFRVIVVQPPKSVRLVSTSSAKVTGHYVQVKDKTPYHLKCEIDGGKPYLRAELVIDGGTRRDARNHTEDDELTVIEESGIMLHTDMVKISCVAIVSESNDFDSPDTTILKRIKKDEKFLQVHYPPHVVECIAESYNETVQSDFQKVKSEADHFTLVMVGRPDAMVCFVRADPDLEEVYWIVGPQHDAVRHGERHHSLNMRATVSRKHEAKMHKNISVYEARLHFGNGTHNAVNNAFTLKAHSKVANVTAVVRLQERLVIPEKRPEVERFSSATASSSGLARIPNIVAPCLLLSLLVPFCFA